MNNKSVLSKVQTCFDDKNIYVLVKEPHSGKTDEVKEFVKNNQHVLFISHKQVKNLYDYNQIIRKIIKLITSKHHVNCVVIDGILDNFDDNSAEELIASLDSLQKKILIVGNNESLIAGVRQYQQEAFNSVLKQNPESADDTEKFRTNDNKIQLIIDGDHHLTWQQFYINYYWWSMLYSGGNITFGDKKYKMNEADCASLIIASRYWGKASQLFSISINTNKYYFGELSTVFFHDGGSKILIDDFLKNIKLPASLSIPVIKGYLSENNKLSYNWDILKNAVNDMNALKPINFDIFLKSLYGRHLLEIKKTKIQPDELQKIKSIISGVAHSTDFLITNLVTKNRDKFNQLISYLEQL